MKAENLVIGKHYTYTRPSNGDVFEAVYLGQRTEFESWVGQHDFDPINRDFGGCICDDDGVEAEISEIEGEEL